jgi:hypothetical protein
MAIKTNWQIIHIEISQLNEFTKLMIKKSFAGKDLYPCIKVIYTKIHFGYL